jgi:hypothetical protein
VDALDDHFTLAARIQVLDEGDEVWVNTSCCQHCPESLSVDAVKRLAVVNKSGEQWGAVGMGQFSEATDGEEVVGAATFRSEATLSLMEARVDGGAEAGNEDVGVHFAADREEADAPVAVTVEARALPLVEVGEHSSFPVQGCLARAPGDKDDPMNPLCCCSASIFQERGSNAAVARGSVLQLVDGFAHLSKSWV